MVMMPEPLANAITSLSKENTYDEIIYVTPDGPTFNQHTANQLSLKNNLLIICGHYKGIDESASASNTLPGKFPLRLCAEWRRTAAAILIDAIGRLLPGVLNDETSALFDSFQDKFAGPPGIYRPAISGAPGYRTYY
jgi:tRNA (guanine37-N1)-methyltransferase